MLLIVPILSKELPLLNEQLPLLVDRINRAVSPWLAQMGINVSLDTASLRAFLIKYLDANLDEGLAAALVSARIGGSIVVTIVGYAILVPVVLFYLLADWPFYVAARDRARAAARCGRACRRRSRTNATSCSASTCAASCS